MDTENTVSQSVVSRLEYNYAMNMPGAIDGFGLALGIARLDNLLSADQEKTGELSQDILERTQDILTLRNDLSDKLHESISFAGMMATDAGVTYEPVSEIKALIDGDAEAVVEAWIHTQVRAEETLIRSNMNEYPAARLAASIPGLDVLIAGGVEGLEMLEATDEAYCSLPFGMNAVEFFRFCELRREMWSQAIHDSIEYADQLAQDGITVQPVPEVAALIRGDVQSVKAINEWRVA